MFIVYCLLFIVYYKFLLFTSSLFTLSLYISSSIYARDLISNEPSFILLRLLDNEIFTFLSFFWSFGVSKNFKASKLVLKGNFIHDRLISRSILHISGAWNVLYSLDIRVLVNIRTDRSFAIYQFLSWYFRKVLLSKFVSEHLLR